MRISSKEWEKYIRQLAAVNEKAANLMEGWLENSGTDDLEALIDYAQALVERYGSAAAELACTMVENVAEVQGVAVTAEPAETAQRWETFKAVKGAINQNRENDIPGIVGRKVKQAGADTVLQNAKRHGAYFAWIPHGDTCAFCLTLASRGWQKASKKTIAGDHAEHIHSNCNCEFAIDFKGDMVVEGYDPDKYLEMYENAEGGTPKEKINAMRREIAAESKDDELTERRKQRLAARRGKTENQKTSEIEFDFHGHDEKFESTKELLQELSIEYRTRLHKVIGGGSNGAGDTDMGGTIRLNSSKPNTTLHEFAHSMAQTRTDKVGLTNDKDFWKEIKAIRRAYNKDVGQDTSRWISSYGTSSTIDEFMAEAFAHAKMKQMGIENPREYGNDFTYSNRVLAVVDKYFGKVTKTTAVAEKQWNGARLSVKINGTSQTSGRQTTKTKYAPSPQRSTGGIQLSPKKYAKLTGTLNTQFPSLEAGEIRIIRDGNYQYTVKADGYGGFETLTIEKL